MLGRRTMPLLVRNALHMMVPRAGMAGHSKWSTIKRSKGAADSQRSLAFVKISKALRAAISHGGPGSTNVELSRILEQAKAIRMPKDVIQRAFDKCEQGKQGHGIRYEGTGPHGVSVIVAAISDNKNRTAALVKEAFNKGKGAIGLPNSQSFKFSRLGEVIVSGVSKEKEDDLMSTALDLGAEEVDHGEEEGEWVVACAVDHLGKMDSGLRSAEYNISSSGIVQRPLALVKVEDGEAWEEVEKFLQLLEDCDDVDEVFHNVDLGEPEQEE